MRKLAGGVCPPCKVCIYAKATGKCAHPEGKCPHCKWLRDRIQDGEVLPLKAERVKARS